MDFSLNEEQLMLKEQVRKFCEAELMPRAKDLDETQEFPYDIYKKAGALGYIGSYIPAEYGGAGGDLFTKAIVYEEFVKILCEGEEFRIGSRGMTIHPR